ncbi:MAG: alpha/beta fold hydrolase [Candidatus Sericytochromatia bacterium]
MIPNINKAVYPFEGKYLDLTDIKIHYLDEGNGDPVVMLHGNPTWSIYYRNLVHTLKNNYRCIVPDHVGCGLSDKPNDDFYEYSLDQRITDIEMMLQYLKINKNITLVMHDWGAMIGMGYALRHPKTVKKLVVMNSFAFTMPEEKKLPMNMRFFRNTYIGSAFLRHFNIFTSMYSVGGTTRTLMDNAVREAYQMPYDTQENRIALQRFMEDMPISGEEPSYDFAKEIEDNLSKFSKLPMLICWGMKDNLFDETFLNEWIKHFPNASVKKFDDCGHYILEDAMQEVCNLIAQFLHTN